jgi:hypothetical protein
MKTLPLMGRHRRGSSWALASGRIGKEHLIGIMQTDVRILRRLPSSAICRNLENK